MKPYTGDESYIFVSYSHKDSDRVHPIINRLLSKGFRVWYDEGIDPGTEWDENIADHLKRCVGILAFLSENYLNSENCRDELNYARDLGKGRLLVYLEPVELPAGMAMRLNRIQAIHMYKYKDPADFYYELTMAPMIKDNNISGSSENDGIEQTLSDDMKISQDEDNLTLEDSKLKTTETGKGKIILNSKHDLVKLPEYKTAAKSLMITSLAAYIIIIVLIFMGHYFDALPIGILLLVAQLKFNRICAFIAAGVSVLFGILFSFIFFVLAIIGGLISLYLCEINRIWKNYSSSGELSPFSPFKLITGILPF